MYISCSPVWSLPGKGAGPHVGALAVGQEGGELVLLGDVGQDVLQDPGGDMASLLQGQHVTDHLVGRAS